MPTVSVIIPTYNHRAFVLQALDSVFSQSLSDYEVIVVNDGSPDDTESLLTPLALRGQIRYFRQANAGQAAARNRGIAEARGLYIALLDDDDLMPSDKLAWQVGMLEQDANILAVAGIAEHIDATGRVTAVGKCAGEIDVDCLFGINPIMSPGQVLIRAETLRSIGGFEAEIWGADDWQLWFEIAKRGRFFMNDRVGLRYRVHAGNATHQHDRLYRGSREVLERQISDSPLTLQRHRRRIAYRFLYQGWGWRFAAACRASALHGKPSQVTSELAKALELITGSRIDLKILIWLLKDLFVGRRS